MKPRPPPQTTVCTVFPKLFFFYYFEPLKDDFSRGLPLSKTARPSPPSGDLPFSEDDGDDPNDRPHASLLPRTARFGALPGKSSIFPHRPKSIVLAGKPGRNKNDHTRGSSVHKTVHTASALGATAKQHRKRGEYDSLQSLDGASDRPQTKGNLFYVILSS